MNHKWNHLISDHPFFSDSFLFRKLYPCHEKQLVWQNPLEKHGKKQVITFFDIDFYFLILFWRAPWLINPKMTEFPRNRICHRHISGTCKKFQGDAKNSQCFLCWGWNVFVAIFWNDKKRGFCCTSRFTSARLEARLIENSFIVHGGAIEQKVLQRPDLGVQKTGVSKNNGIPKSSILIGFSIIFTIHFGVPLFLETSKRMSQFQRN